MHILLPPSESKRPDGGSGVFRQDRLAFDAELGSARARVRDALVELSQNEDAAVKALKLGVKNRAELAHNLSLEQAPVLPAGLRYVGVLYDALGYDTLAAEEQAWIHEHVFVQSALFGLVGMADRIPAYRLSGSSRLPSLEASLKSVWREAHAQIDWRSLGFVLDLRSQDYADLAPLPEGAGFRLHVAQRGPDGEVRALNHFNKAAKGDLVRRLARSCASSTSDSFDFSDHKGLLQWAEAEGLELSADSSGLTLVTDLGAPERVPAGAARSAR